MNVIVAVDQNWAIGKDGDQLVYLSEDLKRFRALTTGHPVILGRKTLATFPGGRPLKGRRNLILSRSMGAWPPRGRRCLPAAEALRAAAPEDAFVHRRCVGCTGSCCPGASTAYVTKIDRAVPGGPPFPGPGSRTRRGSWRRRAPPWSRTGSSFRYVTYRRKRERKS